jgi:uncharacterized protein involved in exopolysaccharide biosynthesis
MPADDEIDLGQLAASLGRRRRLIAGVTLGTVLLTGVVTVLQKPVWEGEFQIVLASQDGGGGGRLAQLAAANPMLAGLAGIGSGGGKDNLETEVKVLGSPSVLKPVFDFVRSAKLGKGEDVERLRYDGWSKSNLDIKLEKGTAVLNISYRDNDKQLILPVIKKISKAYQDYSGRDRRRDIFQAVAYLKGRIAKISPLAEASMRRAQAFALSNGLGIQDGMPAAAIAAGDGGGSGGSPGTISGPVEANRLTAQAQVITLRQQIRNAESSGAEVLFQAPQLEANKDLYKKYQDVEATLAERRSRLREKDPIILGLIRQRSALINTLNKETISLLEGQLASANARLQAASRPKEVVLQHRQLVRQALRDEKTVIELENQLQVAELEQAKQTDPWELISIPTLLDRPVAPKKGRNLALGLLAGLVLGSGAALVAERRTGRIHGSDELASLLPGPLLAVLAANEPESWQQPLQLLSSGPLASANRLALVPIGLATEAAEPVAQALQAASGRPVLCSSDLVATRQCDVQVLLASPGAAERDQLKRLQRDLELQGTPVVGWLLLTGSGAHG